MDVCPVHRDHADPCFACPGDCDVLEQKVGEIAQRLGSELKRIAAVAACEEII